MIDNCFYDLSFHFDTIMDVSCPTWQSISSSGIPCRRPPKLGSGSHSCTDAYTGSLCCLSAGNPGRKGGACPAVLKMTVRGQSEHSQILARQELDKVLLPSDGNTLNAVRRRECNTTPLRGPLDIDSSCSSHAHDVRIVFISPMDFLGPANDSLFDAHTKAH